jgi:Vitamin K-dependent gamma-carboxylase
MPLLNRVLDVAGDRVSGDRLALGLVGEAQRLDLSISGSIFSRDYRALSLFRIALTIVLLADFYLFVLPYYDDLYTDAGLLPLPVLAAEVDRSAIEPIVVFLSALHIFEYAAVFSAIYTAALLAFAVGYHTRVSQVTVFICNIYLYWRNPYVSSGPESLQRLLLLWCLFLPMARYWSFDGMLDPRPRDRPSSLLPFVALRIQVCSVYLFAALFKMEGQSWRQGRAIIEAFSDDLYGSTALGSWLVVHVPELLIIANYAVIVFQLAVPPLVYSPWRNDLTRAFALAGAALMHLSFALFLNVGIFPFLSLAMLLLLLPDRWLEAAAAPWGGFVPGLARHIPSGIRRAWRSLSEPRAAIRDVLQTSRFRPPLAGTLAQGLCGTLMLLALTINGVSLFRNRFLDTAALDFSASLFQVKQRWTLFAPNPTNLRRSFTFLAETGGTLGGSQPFKPHPLEGLGAGPQQIWSLRWAKYMSRLNENSEVAWSAFGDLICRKAGAALPGQTLRAVRISVEMRAFERDHWVPRPAIERRFECSSTPPARGAARTIADAQAERKHQVPDSVGMESMPR